MPRGCNGAMHIGCGAYIRRIANSSDGKRGPDNAADRTVGAGFVRVAPVSTDISAEPAGKRHE
jgi:hypothetical protein